MYRLSKPENKILSRLAKRNDLKDRDFSALQQEYLPLLVEKNFIYRTTTIVYINGREDKHSGYRLAPEGRSALESSRIEKRNNVIDCILKFFAYLIKCFLSIVARFF